MKEFMKELLTSQQRDHRGKILEVAPSLVEMEEAILVHLLAMHG